MERIKETSDKKRVKYLMNTTVTKISVDENRSKYV